MKRTILALIMVAAMLLAMVPAAAVTANAVSAKSQEALHNHQEITESAVSEKSTADFRAATRSAPLTGVSAQSIGEDSYCWQCDKETEWVRCQKEPCDKHFYCPELWFGGKCANPDECYGDCTPYNSVHDYCSECGNYELCWDDDGDSYCERCGEEVPDYNCWVCRKVTKWERCQKETCDEHFYCPRELGGKCANPEECNGYCTPYDFEHDYCSECGFYQECWDYDDSYCDKCGEEVPDYNCWVCRKVTEWVRCPKETCDEHFYCPRQIGGRCANPGECEGDCSPYNFDHDYCSECGTYQQCWYDGYDFYCDKCGEYVPYYNCWVCRKVTEWVFCSKNPCDEHFYCPGQWSFGGECANLYECEGDCTPYDIPHDYCSECGTYEWCYDGDSYCYRCGHNPDDENCYCVVCESAKADTSSKPVESSKPVQNSNPTENSKPVVSEDVTPAAAEALVMRLNSTKALLDGKDIAVDPSNADVSPFTLNGKTMVPVRFVQQLGANVKYDSDSEPVIVSYGDIKLELVFDSDIMKKTVGNAAPVEIKLPTAPSMVEGKTCVPIREVAENLGLSVIYDAASFVIVASVKELSAPDLAAKIEDGKKLNTVIDPVRSISVSPATQTIGVGNNNSVTIDNTMVTFTTESGAAPGCNRLAYSSSNEAVATVTSRGRIVGVAPGIATITLKAHNGKEAKVTITVS